MIIEFVFHFDPNQLRIQDLQTGYHLEMPNQAWVQGKDRLLLALGETEEKTRARLRNRHLHPDRELHSCKLFLSSGEELPYEIQAFQFFTRLLHSQSQRARPTVHFIAKLMDNFDYLLEIPGYESFSETRRRALEESLQAHLRIRRLVINGLPVQIPLWKRNLEFWLRRLFNQILPIAAILIGYLTMPPLITANPLSFLVYLMAIAYFFYYGGKALWMLLVRRLVPRDYRLCMLKGKHNRISRIDQWLAQLVWGIPRS